MPVAEIEVEPLVGVEEKARDLRVVAEPGIAVAARVLIVWIEVGTGDPQSRL